MPYPADGCGRPPAPASCREQSAQPRSANAGEQASPAGEAVPPAEDAENDGTAMTPDDGANPSEQAAIPPDDGARPDDSQRPYDVTAVPPGAVPQGPYGEAPPDPMRRLPLTRGRLAIHFMAGLLRKDRMVGLPLRGRTVDLLLLGPYGDAPQGAYGGAPPGRPSGLYGQGSPQRRKALRVSPARRKGAPQEEWVIVLVSGAGMRATAADDAPMLFAFPYGRNLRVVSHYGDWVEVTDPKSAATGWMKEAEVSPIAPPGAGPPQTEAYDEQQQGQGGWFRRRHGGIADMINRALGGGF